MISLFSDFISLKMQIAYAGSSTNEVVTNESVDQHEGTNSKELILSKPNFRRFICGEEALKISPTEPYCLQRPIRRGHLNISQHYPMQQVQSPCLFSFIMHQKKNSSSHICQMQVFFAISLNLVTQIIISTNPLEREECLSYSFLLLLLLLLSSSLLFVVVVVIVIIVKKI
jgi:hypothetical protein